MRWQKVHAGQPLEDLHVCMLRTCMYLSQMEQTIEMGNHHILGSCSVYVNVDIAEVCLHRAIQETVYYYVGVEDIIILLDCLIKNLQLTRLLTIFMHSTNRGYRTCPGIWTTSYAVMSKPRGCKEWLDHTFEYCIIYENLPG